MRSFMDFPYDELFDMLIKYVLVIREEKLPVFGRHALQNTHFSTYLNSLHTKKKGGHYKQYLNISYSFRKWSFTELNAPQLNYTTI